MVNKQTKQNLSPVQRSKMNNIAVLNQPYPTTSSYPSPSSQQSSHLQVHRNNVGLSHNAFSPASPNSTSNLHQQKNQLPLSQQQNINQQQQQQSIQSNNCWSNLPPNMNNNNISTTLRTSNSSIGNNSNVTTSTGITLKRMQEQNPILNAQLSQDSISYVQIQQHPQQQQQQQQQTLNSQQQSSATLNSNQTLPPSSNSPSLNSGLSMRFNRNSPVLTNNQHLNNSQQQSQGYPLSPNYMNSTMNNNVHSPVNTGSQIQQQQQLNRNQLNSTANQQQQCVQSAMQGQRTNNIQSINVSSGQTYYPSDNLINSNTINVQQTGQVVYGNCVMNNVSNLQHQQQSNNMSVVSNVASSEMVKQGLRAKLGARNHQQLNNSGHQTIQTRAQLPLMQQSPSVQQQSSHLTHIQPSTTTSVHYHQIQQQQSTSSSSSNLPIQQQSSSQNSIQVPVSQQPVLSQSYSTSSTSQMNSNSQLNSSSLTDEDFDAIGLALSVNNDSSFFSFNDLPETNTMVRAMF